MTALTDTLMLNDFVLADFMNKIPTIDQAAWKIINSDFEFRKKIVDDCKSIARSNAGGDNFEHRQLHETLSTIYEREFSAASHNHGECDIPPLLNDITYVLENELLDKEIRLAKEMIPELPNDSISYIHWLKKIISGHNASRHPYYHTFIEQHSTVEDIRYLLAQETCIDPRFDDILALIQLGARGSAKLELAANYWDEMGNGKLADIHSKLFEDALNDLDVTADYISANFLYEARVCGNLSAALALRRKNYYIAIGYFGVTEYLAPRRFKNLVAAWSRLGLPEKGMHYHDLHISVDAGHALGWFRNVVQPAVELNPGVGRDIAIGAMIRLNSSEKYLDALLKRAKN